MKFSFSLWMSLGAASALAGAGAWAQSDLPSPSAEPGRLEAPQPQRAQGEEGGAPSRSEGPAEPAVESTAEPTRSDRIAPTTSPTVQRLLADRTLTNRGPNFGLPALRATLWPRGLAGWLDLSAGVSGGKDSRFENAALNGQIELAPGLRGHFTGVYRDRVGRIRSDYSWQEGYLEGYSFTPALGGQFGWNLRLGRTANLPWPYPSQLSLFDYLPFLNTNSDRYLVGYEHLTGVLDWEHRSGVGFHAALNRRFRHAVGGRGDLGIHPIDYYGRFRRNIGDGYNTELRLGALNNRAGFTGGLTPRWPVAGASLYFGKDWTHGSAGLMVERLDGQATCFGFRLNVSANPITSLLGRFLGRYHRNSDAITAQIPVASLWTGQRPRFTAPLFAEAVGQIDVTRMYTTGNWVQRDVYPLNYEYILRRTGSTKGGGLIRVAHEGPRALSEFTMMDSRDMGEAGSSSRFRQDLTYDLYRMPQLGNATLNIRLVNKLKPSKPVVNASIEAVDQVARKQSLAAPDGKVAYSATVPVDRPQKATLKISAPGFLPETAEVQLAAGEPVPQEIGIRPVSGLLSGVLLDDQAGEPIREVEVVVTGGGGQAKVLLTNARGEFQLPDLPPGRYAIATHAPRYRDQRVPAEIVSGEQKQIEVRLEPRPASVAGKLMSADGKPVADASVTLRDDAGNPVGSFTTLSDGSFGATGLKPGTYTLQAKTTDGATVDATVKLTGGEIATVELKLP